MVRWRGIWGRRVLTAEHVWDRQALAIVSVIFLTEAAIGIIFFSLVQEYPAHLLKTSQHLVGPGHGLLRAGAAYAGYALSAYGLAKFPGQPLSGWLADRVGARPILIIGLTAKLLVIVAMSFVADPLAFVVACAAYGLTAAVIWPALYAIVGDCYPPSQRGRITAGISAAQLAGTAIGFAGGALVIDHAGFGAAFAVTFVLNALSLLLGFVRGSAREGAIERRREGVASSGGFWSEVGGLRELVSANMIMLAAILVLVSVSVSILAPDLRPYSAAILRIPYSDFALLLAIPAVVAIVTLIPSGVISDRFGRSVPMVVAAALWTASLVALPLTRSPWLAVPFSAVAAFAYALGLPAWSASLIDLSTAGRRGLQVGLASAVQTVGLAVGPAAGGLLVANLGALAPFRCSAVLMAAVLILSLAYRSRTARLYVLVQTQATPS
jgi:MFS family permease